MPSLHRNYADPAVLVLSFATLDRSHGLEQVLQNRGVLLKSVRLLGQSQRLEGTHDSCSAHSTHLLPRVNLILEDQRPPLHGHAAILCYLDETIVSDGWQNRGR